MRALPNKWNPRIWLRNWLLAPSREEEEASERRFQAREEKLANRLAELEKQGWVNRW